jgi:decaprenylphospho-beta-D-erythro-pentofuranosid-2-ulose 2-reductase
VIDALGLPESVLVLGGGSDIARATLRLLVPRRTTTVVLGGRPDSASRAAAAAEVRTLGAKAVATVDFDATKPESLVGAVDEAWAGVGDVDLVLVTFGVLGDQEAAEADPVRAVDVATVDYTAAVVAGLAAARRLRDQGYGTLVVLSSVAGERVRRANFVYGSAKAGMDGFYQGLSDALTGSGAKVIVVRPGFVHTKMTAGVQPAPFATTPEAVADAILAALPAPSRTVWVPAVLRPAMAVLRHLPRPLWRMMPG